MGLLLQGLIFLLETQILTVFKKKKSLVWLHWVLVAAHGIFDLCFSMQGRTRLKRLSSSSSRSLVAACRIQFSDQGSNLGSLHWNQGVLNTGLPGKSLKFLLFYPPSSSIAEVARSGQFSSIAQSRLTLCNPMDCSTPGLPVHHQLPEFTQTYVH